MLERIPRSATPVGVSQLQNVSSENGRKAKRVAIRDNRAEARSLAPDPLLNPKEAAAEAGVAVSTWWKGVKHGRFPRPTYVLPRCPRWRRSEVQAAVQGGV